MAGFENDIAFSLNADFTQADNQAPSESNGLITNGQMWIGTTATNAGGTHINVGSITSPNGSITLGYSSPNITLEMSAGAPYYSLTGYIVGPDVHSQYTTVGAGVAAAALAGGGNVYIKPGTYTENVTMAANVNLVGFGNGYSVGPVIIAGTLTASFSGFASIVGVTLRTNGAAFLNVTSAAAISIENCILNATNATGFTCSHASGLVTLQRCTAVASSGRAIFNITATGGVSFSYCSLDSLSGTASNISSGILYFFNSGVAHSITTSSTGIVHYNNCNVVPFTNQNALTTAGTGTSFIRNSNFKTGSGITLTIGAGSGLQVYNSVIDSSAVNVITGAGSLSDSLLTFVNSNGVSVSTRVPIPLTVAEGGTAASSFNINGVAISNTTTTGALSALTLTNGQIVIGSTGAAPLAATLTAGAGVSVTNAANSITIAASGAGLTWTDVTGASQTVAASNGYLSNRAGAVAFTLPASSTVGDVFRIVGVQGSWSLAQSANQQVKFGSSATTVGAGGSLASTNAGDSIELVATNTSASSIWRVMSSVGNITVV